MNTPNRIYLEFPNWDKYYRPMKSIQRFAQKYYNDTSKFINLNIPKQTYHDRARNIFFADAISARSSSPELNSFFFIQSLFTLASISYLFLIFIKEKFVLGRLYYVLSAFICIFYQIPLTLFSQQVEHSLSNPWYFALTINGAILILTAWGRITKNIRTHQSMSEFPANIASIYVTTGLIGILCIIFYFYNIPWSCTGLYAILNDPWLTLLARI